MNVKFNLEGTNRRALVNAISEILDVKPVYTGTAGFAYMLDVFRVERDGSLSFDDMTDSEAVENLLEELDKKGFKAIPAEEVTEREEEPAGRAETKKKEDTPEQETAESQTPDLSISLPVSMVNVENLKKILEAKGELIQKALGLSELPIEVRKDEVVFPWFSRMPETDAVRAYTRLISALCQMSRESRRITAKRKTVDNEKYAFRCFLLRLGFIGAEYKADRKILLKNFKGSSAFKKEKKEGSSDAVSQ